MIRLGPIWLVLLLSAFVVPAADWTEDFSVDPALHGWRVHGDESLFHWNKTSQALEAIWDSSRTNTFYFRPLETILAETDPFEVSFELEFSEIQAGGPDGTGSTFELGFGLYGMTAATRTNFSRGSGVNAANGPRDIVEFTYFPDTANGFGDTISPSIWSRSNQPHVAFVYPFPLATGVSYRVAMRFDPTLRALDTVLVSNSVPVLTNRVTMPKSSTGFRLDSVAVASYQSFGGGSLVAHARVDNIRVEVPDPPSLAVSPTLEGPELAFLLPTNWVAAVERTIDFNTWETAVPTNAIPAGNGSVLRLVDGDAPVTNASYRLKLFRP